MSSFKYYFLDYFESAWLQGNFPPDATKWLRPCLQTYIGATEGGAGTLVGEGNNESRTKPSKKYVELEKRRQNLMTDYDKGNISRSYYLTRMGSITLKPRREEEITEKSRSRQITLDCTQSFYIMTSVNKICFSDNCDFCILIVN